jgi:hypothetical protein
MTDIAELTIRIKADTAQLKSEMAKAQGVVQQSSGGMMKSLSGVRAAAGLLGVSLSVGAFVAFGKSAFQAADRLNDLAQRTGVAASTLSALNVPLQQGGASVEEFAASVTRMNNMIGEAAKGINQEAVKAFDDLGLSIRALQQLSPEEQFFAVAKALSQMESQSQMTNAGMAIFGRSFSTLIPLIKDTNGNLAEFVKNQKETGNALTEEELKLIDEWGDRWTAAIERAKLSMIQFVDGLANYRTRLGDELLAIQNSVNVMTPSGVKMVDKDVLASANSRTSTTRPDVQSDASVRAAFDKAAGINQSGAKGSNAGLLKPSSEAKAAADAIKAAKKSLADYNTELSRQSEYAKMAPSEAKARKAYYDTLDLAQKAGIKNAEGLATANESVARSNERMNEKMQESARFAAELKDQFAQTAADIIFDSKSAGDALKGLSQALAKMILQRGVLAPLSDGLFGAPNSGGGGIFGSIFSNFSLPSFDVGTDFVPRDMIAQIHKGERVVPANQNNAAGMGGSVMVKQYFTINAGVAAEVRNQVAAAAPVIANAARNAVFSDIQKGGSASKIVGVR